MLRLFPCVALEGFSHFRIALAVGLACHGKVHAHFAAFAVEVCVEVFDHFLVAAFCHADFVFGHELEFSLGVEFFEFRLRSTAHGALFGSFRTFVHVAADNADKFLVHNSLN